MTTNFFKKSETMKKKKRKKKLFIVKALRKRKNEFDSRISTSRESI